MTEEPAAQDAPDEPKPEEAMPPIQTHSDQPGSETPSGSDQPGGSTPPPFVPSDSGTGAEFFDRIRSFGIVRTQEDRWLAGVCGAAARRWNVDPILTRGIGVVLLILGPGILLYGLAWAFLPKEDGRIHAQQVLVGDVSSGFVGAALLVAAWLLSPLLHLGSDRLGWGAPGGLLVAAVIVFVIWWFAGGRNWFVSARNRRQGGWTTGPAAGGEPGTDPGARPTGDWYGPGQRPASEWGSELGAASRRLGAATAGWGAEVGAASKRASAAGAAWAAQATESWQAPRRIDPQAPSKAVTRTALGLALLAGAGTVLADSALSLPGSTPVLALSVALGVVAVGIVVAGVLGRRPGGLAPIGVLLTLALLSSFAVGERNWQPAGAVAARAEYRLVAGEAVLDVRNLPATGSNLRATVGLGHLTVRVPAGMSAEVRTAIGAGSVEAGDSADALRTVRHGDGNENHRTVLVVGDPQRAAETVIDAQVGLGEISVIGAGAKVSTP